MKLIFSIFLFAALSVVPSFAKDKSATHSSVVQKAHDADPPSCSPGSGDDDGCINIVIPPGGGGDDCVPVDALSPCPSSYDPSCPDAGQDNVTCSSSSNVRVDAVARLPRPVRMSAHDGTTDPGTDPSGDGGDGSTDGGLGGTGTPGGGTDPGVIGGNVGAEIRGIK